MEDDVQLALLKKLLNVAGGLPSIVKGGGERGGGAEEMRYESCGCGGGNLFQRIGSVVREQRARFYIARRCVLMLVCWKDCTDS
ncbi:unnamed protein product [Cuscuta campestris]|uniref:Uncharacterized protein n=1 Tax=Cuscuta campestris TaxID=132261 RepID=A0A484KKU9_9ASTE|nr:unnamed protein product [Cuscuta campestris]